MVDQTGAVGILLKRQEQGLIAQEDTSVARQVGHKDTRRQLIHRGISRAVLDGLNGAAVLDNHGHASHLVDKVTEAADRLGRIHALVVAVHDHNLERLDLVGGIGHKGEQLLHSVADTVVGRSQGLEVVIQSALEGHQGQHTNDSDALDVESIGGDLQRLQRHIVAGSKTDRLAAVGGHIVHHLLEQQSERVTICHLLEGLVEGLIEGDNLGAILLDSGSIGIQRGMAHRTLAIHKEDAVGNLLHRGNATIDAYAINGGLEQLDKGGLLSGSYVQTHSFLLLSF